MCVKRLFQFNFFYELSGEVYSKTEKDICKQNGIYISGGEPLMKHREKCNCNCSFNSNVMDTRFGMLAYREPNTQSLIWFLIFSV